MKTVYTPQLDPDLVHQLYLKAKAQQVPMTVLTRHLLRNALETPQPTEPPRACARRRRSRQTTLSKRQLAQVVEQATDASQHLDQFINAFGTLVLFWCRLAEEEKARRRQPARPKHRQKSKSQHASKEIVSEEVIDQQQEVVEQQEIRREEVRSAEGQQQARADYPA